MTITMLFTYAVAGFFYVFWGAIAAVFLLYPLAVQLSRFFTWINNLGDK